MRARIGDVSDGLSTRWRHVAPDFLTVEEAARVVRIGRTSAYELARRYLDTDGAEGLPVVRFGRQLRVPRCRLEETLGGPISWPVARPDPVGTATAAAPVVLTARTASKLDRA